MADVPTAEAGRAADLIDQAAAIVSAFPVVEGRQAVSRRADLPGRGNALAAPFVVVQSGGPDDPWVAQGMFTSAYIGRVAVHGGWVAHLFDEFLGRLAEFPSEPARTAYLTVNFRALTPVGVPLRLEYKVSAREGRKIFATGRLLDGDGLTAEAEGLWVKLRRG
jgi:acyl-coenzyme A thioesterase PaaI-like protein